jgi:hypothetical protein
MFKFMIMLASCFTMGEDIPKMQGLASQLLPNVPKCWAELSYCLILGPLAPWGFTLHSLLFCKSAVLSSSYNVVRETFDVVERRDDIISS